MKLSDLKDFNIYYNQIKNLFLIQVKQNRLVDAEFNKQIFYFSKYFNFMPKKYCSNFQRNLNV